MGNSEEKILKLVKEFCKETCLQTPDSITDDFVLRIWVFIASNDSKIRELCDVVAAENEFKNNLQEYCDMRNNFRKYEQKQY